MWKYLQSIQVFSNAGEIPLLTDLFGCFPVEPFSEEENAAEMEGLSLTKEQLAGGFCDKQTQTERAAFAPRRRTKRTYSMTNPVEDEPQSFKLLQAPGNYTLTEMFDDLRSVGAEQNSPTSQNSPSTSNVFAPPIEGMHQSVGSSSAPIVCAEYPPPTFLTFTLQLCGPKQHG
ncbi:hypothetical protein OSTOST_16359 [Ostertagia ostertagi]